MTALTQANEPYWKNLPGNPIYKKFYLYNCTNPDEVIYGY